jgi:hypothetical protein
MPGTKERSRRSSWRRSVSTRSRRAAWVSSVRVGMLTRGEEEVADISMGVRIRVVMKEDLFVFRHKGSLSPFRGDLANLAKTD